MVSRNSKRERQRLWWRDVILKDMTQTKRSEAKRGTRTKKSDNEILKQNSNVAEDTTDQVL